jgi:HEAT repeat protein
VSVEREIPEPALRLANCVDVTGGRRLPQPGSTKARLAKPPAQVERDTDGVSEVLTTSVEETAAPAVEGRRPPKIKVSVREAEIDALRRSDDATSVDELAVRLGGEANENLRIRCVDALASKGQAALNALSAALAGDSSRSVRVHCAHALGMLGTQEAVEPLTGALHAADSQVRLAAIEALGSVGGPGAVAALIKAVGTEEEAWLNGLLVTELGKTGDPLALPVLRQAARSREEPIVKAGLTALRVVAPGDLVTEAPQLLREWTDAKIRQRITRELSQIQAPEAVPLLVRTLLADADADVREICAEGLARVADGPTKLAAVFDALADQRIPRGDVDCPRIIRAVRTGTQQGVDDINSGLVTQALTDNPSLIGVVADLLVANNGNDPDQVGSVIDKLQKQGDLSPESLQHLRIEVGGHLTLDPVLKVLSDNLRKYFQEPIEQLNKQTSEAWLDTINSARNGFKLRVWMSVIVFGAGLLLIALSVVLFLSGKLTSAEAVGSGTTFAGGLTATLLVVYSGPLKDIRQSVSDLGAANVTFIGFIHQVLQVSHTFSAHYLKEGVSFDEVKGSAEIIRAAAVAATTALAVTPGEQKATGG